MHRFRWIVGLFLLGMMAVPAAALAQEASPVALPPTPGEVVAEGLANPRGMTWGPDGAMYVALAGSGEKTSQIVKIVDGVAEVVIDGMPSSVAESGSVEGIADVAFIGDQLYFLLQGAGPGHGNTEMMAGVYMANADGTATMVADLSTWIADTLKPTDDHSPNGDPDAMIAAADALWVTLGNPDALVKVTPDGTISLVVDVFASFGHTVPTDLVADAEGNVYISNLTAFPFADGDAKVFKVAPDGTITEVWSGLTANVAVAIDADGNLVAVEMSTGNSPQSAFNPASGRVVRQTGPHSHEVIAEGLNFPIKARVGADGFLYVSGPALGADGGTGWITKIEI